MRWADKPSRSPTRRVVSLLHPGLRKTGLRYVGPEYRLSGAICRRWVEADYKVDAVQCEPYGIMTSYGKYIREAP